MNQALSDCALRLGRLLTISLPAGPLHMPSPKPGCSDPTFHKSGSHLDFCVLSSVVF